MKRHEIIIVFCYFILLYVVLIPFFWNESVDPAFIENEMYGLVVYKILPLLFVCFVGYLAYLYPRSEKIQDMVGRIMQGTSLKEKIKNISSIIVSLFGVYLFIAGLFTFLSEMKIYYFGGTLVSHEYKLISYSECGVDYGPNCLSLRLFDEYRNNEETIYWYEDKAKIKKLYSGHPNKYIRFSGYASSVGYILTDIEWDPRT